VAALSARLLKNGGAVPSHVDAPADIATEVLKALQQTWDARRAEAISAGTLPQSPYAFELATKVEALVALRPFTEARNAAEIYVEAEGSDAFELGSTERQLRELWELDTDPDPNAARVLAIIRAKLLTRQGGAVSIAPEGIKGAVNAASDLTLEAKLGNTDSVTLA